VARGTLYDPRWPWHAAATPGATVKAPAPIGARNSMGSRAFCRIYDERHAIGQMMRCKAPLKLLFGESNGR
jgi:hypothetical protein